MIANIQELNFSYGPNKKNTLNNINIKIKSGERILLAGPNGAGKSTLLRLMSGIHLVSSRKSV